MLKMLRAAGDANRLSIEFNRFGASSSSFPPEMVKEIVAAVQSEIDVIRNSSVLNSSGFTSREFQSYFDKAFELAASVPISIAATPSAAKAALGEERYTEVRLMIETDTYSLHQDLVDLLVDICSRRMK